MRSSGVVLAGGRSARMGQDKALLAYRGRTLVEHVARQVLAATGTVRLIGPPERYSHLGIPTQADLEPGHGPMGGLLTALATSDAEWNLIVACDMPNISKELLEDLMAREPGNAWSVAPLGPGGKPEPLCAVYHVRCLPMVRRAIVDNRLKMMDLLAELKPLLCEGFPEGAFANLNTPGEREQWEAEVRR